MSDFQITNTPKEAAFNIRMFVKEHREEYKIIFSPLIPYLTVIVIVTIGYNLLMQSMVLEFIKDNPPPSKAQDVLTYLNASQSHVASNPLSYLSIVISVIYAYCFAVLAINWHRVVLLGVGRYEPMNILSPKKHEKNFVLVWVMIGTLIPYLTGAVLGINIALIIISVVIFPYILFKICFYFPAKALDSHLSFKNSFKLTNGCFWAFILTTIRSCWRVALVFFIIMTVIGMISAIIASITFPDYHTAPYLKSAYNQIVGEVFNIIISTFIFSPLFTILGVTLVSNFYQYTLRHRATDYNLDK